MQSHFLVNCLSCEMRLNICYCLLAFFVASNHFVFIIKYTRFAMSHDFLSDELIYYCLLHYIFRIFFISWIYIRFQAYNSRKYHRRPLMVKHCTSVSLLLKLWHSIYWTVVDQESRRYVITCLGLVKLRWFSSLDRCWILLFGQKGLLLMSHCAPQSICISRLRCEGRWVKLPSNWFSILCARH